MPLNTSLSDHLPLTESTFLILLSLASEPKHGYAIMQDVRELSEDRVILSTGTLYGALKRLLNQGWIQPQFDRRGPREISGRQRKSYRLSKNGRRILRLETSRLLLLAEKAKLRI